MNIISVSFHVYKPLYDEVLASARNLAEKAVAQRAAESTQFTKILIDVDPQASSFAMQLHTPDLEHTMSWLEEEGREFFESLANRHGENAVWFVTPMEVI